jgi:4-coumarate--CoA ligase
MSYPRKSSTGTSFPARRSPTAALRLDAARCALGLQQLDLQEGDVVCVIIPNSTDFVLLAHSVWWAGATFSALNPSYTVSDIAHSLDLVKPTHVVVAGA